MMLNPATISDPFFETNLPAHLAEENLIEKVGANSSRMLYKSNGLGFPVEFFRYDSISQYHVGCSTEKTIIFIDNLTYFIVAEKLNLSL